MKELKWIKLSVSVFENRKIKYLSRMEGGEFYELIWIKLLCLAGQINDGGRIYLSKRRMITPEEIADIIGMPEDTVCEAILLFDELDMITYNSEDGFVIKNYSEYQSGAEERGEEEEILYNERGAEAEAENNITASEESEKQYKNSENIRAYQREMQRRSREKKRQKDVIDTRKDVIDSQKDVIDTSKMSLTVSKMSMTNVKNSPKNIFIEENREEENRIDENRLDEIRIEESGGESGRTECAIKFSQGESEIRQGRLKFSQGESEIFAEAKVEETTIPHRPWRSSLCTSEPEECADAPTQERREEPIRAVSEREADCFSGEERASLGEICANAPTHPEKKNRYGIFNNVLLSDKEYSELSLKCPDIADELIEDFSSHMEATGKEYRNHYAVLLRWSKNEFAPGRAEDNRKKVCEPSPNQRGQPRDIKKSSAGEKRRYGDFDPMEAFRLALERSEG